MKLLKCAIHCAIAGTVGFFFGRLISQCPIKPDKGLFRCFFFEKNGAFYEKLGMEQSTDVMQYNKTDWTGFTAVA